MIDTICLLIPKAKMTFLDGVSSWDLYSSTDQYKKFVRNPNKAEKGSEKYFPRLTGYSRRFGQDANVRIEFSVPKLVFLNNLEELEDSDFELVIETLQERLRDLGVIVSKNILENASVSSVHFSKNIPLKNGYTVNYLISEMGKVNLRKDLDVGRKTFINDGQSLYFHATSHQFVVYDKVSDMGKDKKRAIDKDQTLFQTSLFSQLKSENALKEIIRFEIRLSKKQKMNKVLEDLGYQKSPTFKDVFNIQMSKSVVIHYWNKFIKEGHLGLFQVPLSDKDILQKLFLSSKKLKPKQAIYFFGLYKVSKDENGLRHFRTMLSKRSTNMTWYRIVKDIESVNRLVSEKNLRDWIVQIDESLADYKTYKVED